MVKMGKTNVLFQHLLIYSILCWLRCAHSTSFENTLIPDSGINCETVNFVALPSTHGHRIASALSRSMEKSTQKLIITPVADMMLKDKKIPSGACTILLYRDFRQVLCTMARHHGDCRQCSSTAMEAKIKHWTSRLFTDDHVRRNWAEWLLSMKIEGTPMLKFECLEGVTMAELQHAFSTWLGTSHEETQDTSLVLSNLHDDWQSCFTDSSFTTTQESLSDLSSHFGYDASHWGDATCEEDTVREYNAPVTTTLASGSSAQRLERFKQRVGNLQVSSVDARFLNKLKGENLQQCTKAGCLPDFITIGAQKGGTTSLYYYLKNYHPDLETSKLEELNFFTERYTNGVKWLRAQFSAKPNKLRGYKSPNYFPHPLVPFRIKAILPHVKFVLLLREPLSRAKSAYAMGVLNGKEKRSLDEALGSEFVDLKHCLEVEVPQHQWPRIACLWKKFYPTWASSTGLKVDSWKGMVGPMGSYLMPGLYALQLRHWLRCFPLSQFHIMSSKDFQKDTAVAMMGLATFLDPNYSASGANQKVLDSRHRADKKSKAPVLSEHLKQRILAFYEPFNQELWKLLDKELDW